MPARARLDGDLERLARDQTVVLELEDLADLVREPDADPFATRRGPQQAGVDDLAATLAAARHLPGELTVRVVLPAGATVDPPVAEVEAALRRRAAYLSSVAWREGMFQRAMGLRQLVPGMLIAAIAWALAYAFAYAATEVDGAGVGLLAVSAMLSITVAWVASWWVVETVIFDWRPDAIRARAYDLLSRARLEVVTDGVHGQSSGR